jgi:hypothetical protein
MCGGVVYVEYCILGAISAFFLSVAYVVYVQYARELHVKIDTGMVIPRPNQNKFASHFLQR